MKLAEVLLKDIDLETNGLSVCFSAKRFSGKTFLIKELLNDPLIKKTYEEIYVFSDTGTLDKTWEEVKNKNVFVIDEYKEQDLIKMLESFKQENANKKVKTKVLIIIDDLIEVYSNKRKSPISKLATRGRHYGISFIYTSQRYIRFPPDVRTNTTSKVFFKITNGKELKAIRDELGTKFFDIEGLIDDVTELPYNYLLIKDAETTTYYEGNGLDVEQIDLKS